MSCFIDYRKEGEFCNESDLITEQYPEPHLNPECEMYFDVGDANPETFLKDEPCADGHQWVVSEVYVAYHQEPVDPRKGVTE